MTIPVKHEQDALLPGDLARMRSVIKAVCDELGVQAREQARREAVAERVLDAYRHGGRLPLNLVAAGLAEPAGIDWTR